METAGIASGGRLSERLRGLGSWALVCVVLLCCGRFVDAGELSPAQDDAALHAVAFVSATEGWAVGDRGTILRTTDAGETWSGVSSPSSAHLQAIHFLDGQTGWIVGGDTKAFTGRAIGVVLKTTDGGKTWKLACDRALPLLRGVQFFNEREGVAFGESNATYPNGVLTTSDGGATWQRALGTECAGWMAGAFANPGVGFLVGMRGEQARVRAGEVVPDAAAASLRGLHDFCIDHEAQAGWIVGDGGLVMRSSGGGSLWEAVNEKLPREMGLVFNLKTVTARGGKIWAAGLPGTVVWHSPDSGATWAGQATGESMPIYDLCVVEESRIVAVGALGKIQIGNVSDGQWRTVKGGGRRLAALALHAHPDRIGFLQMTRDADERGYREGAWILARRDVGPAADRNEHAGTALRNAVLSAGGTTAEIEWRLPIGVPGLDRQSNALLAEWSQVTDQKLEEVLVATLATQIRTWRPSVVLLDEARQDDVPTRMLHAALPSALRRAAEEGSGAYSKLWATAQLKAWEPARTLVRKAGNDATIRIDPFQWLPHRNDTLLTAASAARIRLGAETASLNEAETWSELVIGAKSPGEAREVFEGLPIAAGSDARRISSPILQDNAELALHAAQRQRTFSGVAKTASERPGGAESLMAQLGSMLEDTPPKQAAIQLWTLANEQRRRGEWDGAESTLMQLVERYPNEPAATLAMSWLLTFWSSEEMEWQRSRRTAADRSIGVAEKDAGGALTKPVLVRQAAGEVTVGDLRSVIGASARAIGAQADLQGEAINRRQLDANKRALQAARILELMRQVAPEEVESPTVQLCSVVMLRRSGKGSDAAAALRRLSLQQGTGMTRLARGEVWAMQPAGQCPQKLYLARLVEKPPVLDGVLSDECWETCKELQLDGIEPAQNPLEAPNVDVVSAGPRAFCFIAYDSRYLYLAGSVPRSPRLPKDLPDYAGRKYDSDLDAFDRLSFAFDTNRDYTSAYRFDVDQRGATRDQCWEDQTWNPKWYVACRGDENHWRIEIAIPWDELTNQPPVRGNCWGLGVQRTMPGVGWESWLKPVEADFEGRSLGLVRFE